MIRGIHHTGLSVKDLDAAVSYYCTGGAFRDIARYACPKTACMEAGMQGEAALLRGPTGYLELMHFPDNIGAQIRPFDVHEQGIRHVCLQDRDVTPFFDRHVEAGASWHARPAGLGTGALYAYIRDPEGNILELEGLPWSSSEGVRPWYAHTALVTPDIDRLSAFYETLTGISCHRRGAFGPNSMLDTVAGLKGVELKGAWIKLPVGVIEMWEYTAPTTLPAERKSLSDLGWNHLSFEVDDLQAAAQHVNQITTAPVSSIIETEMAQSLYTRDPDGNRIELFKLKASHSDLSVHALDGLDFMKTLSQDLIAFQQKRASA